MVFIVEENIMVAVVGTNSYVDEAEADAYFADSINSAAWDASSSSTKNKALISATRYLDRQLWQGVKTVDTQDLEWPRTGAFCNGVQVDPNTVPDRIKEAQMEMAQKLISSPTLSNNLNTGSNTKRAKAGSAEVEFFRATKGTILPDVVQQLAGCFLKGFTTSSSGVGLGATATGLDSCTSFGSGAYDRTKGFS